MHLTGLLDFPTSGLLYFTNSDTPSFVSMFSVSSFRLLSPSIVISPSPQVGEGAARSAGVGLYQVSREQHSSDVVLMVIDETGDDARENRRRRQLLGTHILHAVEQILQRVVDVDRRQLPTTVLILLSKVEEQIPRILRVVLRDVILTHRVLLRPTTTTLRSRSSTVVTPAILCVFGRRYSPGRFFAILSEV